MGETCKNLQTMIKRTLYFGNPAYLHKKDLQLKIAEPETRAETPANRVNASARR